MIRKMLMVLGLTLMVMPTMALADASVVQEYCEQWVEGSYDLILIHLTVVNTMLPESLCDLHFLLEPGPPGCEIVDFTVPSGWSGVPNGMGGIDFFANTPGDCVPPGGSLGGFGIVVPIPDWCCYVVQFTGPDGSVMLEQEECFTCTLIGNEVSTWGSLKALYE